MSDQIFEDYESAHAYSLTVPWKLQLCNTGESCWCRIIAPVEPIKYKRDIPIDLLIKSSEITDEIDYIIPDGSIDKETAEYFLELHHKHIGYDK